ncbi:hypothetical protein NT6N_15650 [Oceaniferula spumae]|uniref:Uncharacterized protein n=1 Tax=Oceaniferula spumae TaxID=2979115 RepID=A0AAT9FKN2_9BACT
MKLIVLTIALITTCAHTSETMQDGAKYKQALTEAVKSADQIVIMEHSHSDDFRRANIKAPEKNVIYKKASLNAAQTKLLLSDLEKMPGTTKSKFAACIFWPHHTIQFYKKKKLLSSIELCYHCDDSEWSSTKLVPPAKLLPTLSQTLKRLGMSTERNWVALTNRVN